MKKTFLGLLGIVGAMLTMFTIVKATGEITDYFIGNTPLSEDSYQKLLTEYNTQWGYNQDTNISTTCQYDGINISSQKIHDVINEPAGQYRLFISPYSVNQLKNGDTNVNKSEIIVKISDNPNFSISFNELQENTTYYGFIVPIDIYDEIGTPSREIEFNTSKCITLKPGLNTFSTPAIVESISFSNGGSNISFFTMENGKWKATTVNNENIKTTVTPLNGYLIRNNNSGDIAMTLAYDKNNSDSLVLSKELTAGWNFLGVTTTDNPFKNIASATWTMILDLTNGKSTNLIELGKTFLNATKFMLGKAYAIFVNNPGVYGGTNNYGDTTNDGTLTLIPDNKNILNILLIGYGGNNWEGSYLIPDSIIVVSWNLNNNNVTLTPLPFISTYTPLRFTDTYGLTPEELAINTKDIISHELGLDISNYATMDFAAFKELIDLLGGVDVYVDKSINDNQYPNDLGFNNSNIQFYRNPLRGYSPFNINKGEQHLNGETALKYVRSINTTSDSDRAYRQIKVLQAIKDKIAVSGFDISDLYNLYKIYNNNITTNISLYDSYWIIKHINEIQNISFSSYCDYPEIALACALDSTECPNFCKPVGTLTNNLTKTVRFQTNEASLKVVFDGTYKTNNTPVILNKFYMSGTNNITGVNITWHLYLDEDIYEAANTNTLGSIEETFGYNVAAGESINVKVEAEVVTHDYTGEINDIEIYLGGTDKSGNEIEYTNAKIANIEVIKKDQSVTIPPISEAQKPLLKAKNPTIAEFIVKPAKENDDEVTFEELVLSETIDTGAVDANKLRVKVDGIELDNPVIATEADLNAGIDIGDFIYSVDRGILYSGVVVEVIYKGEFSGKIGINVKSINKKKFTNSYSKYFVESLVTFTKQDEGTTSTEYTLAVEHSDENYIISNFTVYSGCTASAGTDVLKTVGDVEDGDTFTVMFGDNAQEICGVSYTVDGADASTKNVLILKSAYKDYFKVNEKELAIPRA